MRIMKSMCPRDILFLICGILLFSGISRADTDGDFTIIRNRLIKPLIGSVDADTADEYIQSMQSDGSWEDIDYADSTRSVWKPPEHLSRLGVITRAYAASGFSDAEKGKAAHRALGYWLKHDYGNPNWWWNVIGVPRSLGPVLLMLENELDENEKSKGIEILRRGKLGMTGQNLVWVALITLNRGILERDPSTAHEAVSRIADEIFISAEEGIQPDYSFYQHGDLLYSHGYGAGFAADCSRIAAVLAGTEFAFPREKIDILASMILDGHQWMMRKDMADYGAKGREITRMGISGAYMKGVADNMLKLDTGRSAEFRALRTRVTTGEGPLTGNRHFWRSDFMAHHRADWYASVRMHTKRVSNTDGAHNEEGLKSHNLADGCTYIMLDGDEYFDIFPVWDWRKIPGTTAVQVAELTGRPKFRGQTTFAGGVSDGYYGMAAFDFGRGGLAARKAWFMTDNAFVCLGAGITSDAPEPVFTTVNQCHLTGEVITDHGGEPRTLDRATHTLEHPGWVYHDSVGYIFPESASVTLKNDINTGRWYDINHSLSRDTLELPVFTLGFDHGVRPRNNSYAYIVAPAMTLETFKHFSADTGLTIVANTPSLQCVSDAHSHTSGIAFHRAGTIDLPNGLSVSADIPCLVLVRDDGERLWLSVANPENAAAHVTITVNRRLKWAEPSGSSGSSVAFDLPGGLMAGKSVTRSYPYQ